MRTNSWIRLLCALLITTTVAVRLLGHHSSNAQFDSSKVQTIQGVVTVVSWTNPHVYVSLQTKNQDGSTRMLKIGLGAPRKLTAAGVGRNFIEPMKTYSITIWPSRDGSPTAVGITLIGPDGHSFDVSGLPSELDGR